MTLEELSERINQRLVVEREERKEACAADMNSYGAGYSTGMVDALEQVLNTINGEEENTL